MRDDLEQLLKSAPLADDYTYWHAFYAGLSILLTIATAVVGPQFAKSARQTREFRQLTSKRLAKLEQGSVALSKDVQSVNEDLTEVKEICKAIPQLNTDVAVLRAEISHG